MWSYPSHNPRKSTLDHLHDLHLILADVRVQVWSLLLGSLHEFSKRAYSLVNARAGLECQHAASTLHGLIDDLDYKADDFFTAFAPKVVEIATLVQEPLTMEPEEPQDPPVTEPISEEMERQRLAMASSSISALRKGLRLYSNYLHCNAGCFLHEYPGILSSCWDKSQGLRRILHVTGIFCVPDCPFCLGHASAVIAFLQWLLQHSSAAANEEPLVTLPGSCDSLMQAPRIRLISLHPFRAYVTAPRRPSHPAHAERYAQLAKTTQQQPLSRGEFEDLLGSPRGSCDTLHSQQICELGILVTEPVVAGLQVQAALRMSNGMLRNQPSSLFHLHSYEPCQPCSSNNCKRVPSDLHVLNGTPHGGVTLGAAADRAFDERLSIRSSLSMSTEASLQKLKTNVFASHVSTIGMDRMRHIMDGGRTDVAAEETAWLEIKRELEAQQLLQRGARRDGKLLPGKGENSCEHVIAKVTLHGCVAYEAAQWMRVIIW